MRYQSVKYQVLSLVIVLLTAPANAAQLPAPGDLKHVGWQDRADQVCPVFTWTYPEASVADDLNFFWEAKPVGDPQWKQKAGAVPGIAKKGVRDGVRHFQSHGPCATKGGSSGFIRLRACRGIVGPCNPRLLAAEKASKPSNRVSVSYDQSPEAPVLKARRVQRQTVRLYWESSGADGTGAAGRGVDTKPYPSRFRVKARLKDERGWRVVSTVGKDRKGMVIRRLRPGLWYFHVEALNSWGKTRSNGVEMRIKAK